MGEHVSTVMGLCDINLHEVALHVSIFILRKLRRIFEKETELKLKKVGKFILKANLASVVEILKEQ